MSGGRFDYQDFYLKNAIFDGATYPKNVFEDLEISKLVFDVLDLIHDYDWYISGDTRRETYLIKKEEFKKRWFGNNEVRAKEIVDERINELRTELYETFGLREKHDD